MKKSVRINLRIAFFLVTVASLFACTAEKSTKNGVELTDRKQIPLEIAEDTSFNNFFDKFMFDKSYQKSRIVFPIQTDRGIINADDWIHLPFYSMDEFMPILDADTLHHFERVVKDSIVNLFTIDFAKNRVDRYNFRCFNNKWTMHSFILSSMKEVPDYEFIQFLIAFSADSIFQVEHTRFPFLESIAEPDLDYEIKNYEIEKETWRHYNLTEYIGKLSVLSAINTKNQYRTVYFSGIENGIYLKYTFKKINGSWTFIRYEDFST